ncbi:MAG: hypothetical protein AAGB02_07575 [Pseudomonadota bacterium]
MAKIRITAAAAALVIATQAAAQLAPPQVVEAETLAKDAFSTGVLGAGDNALRADLWRESDPEMLEFLLLQAPARPATPSLGEALKRTLLTTGAAPANASPSLGGKKLLALSRAGFVDEANTIASLSTVGGGDPWTGQAMAIGDLLGGDTERACRRNANLTSGRDEPFWVKLRVLCYAVAGESDAADLTLGVLREQGALTGEEEEFLAASITGAAPKTPPAATSVLEFAIARHLDWPLAPGVVKEADGGVLVALMQDNDVAPGVRIAAALEATALGAIDAASLRTFIEGFDFEPAMIAEAVRAAREKPNDPMTDVLLYHSVKSMTAPEFLRDKAQRVALALGLADGFSRAYGLSLLYADEIVSLEGAVVSPDESSLFADARMVLGDGPGAGAWLLSALSGDGVSAMSEGRAMAFIDQVNRLAILDPQTATSVARAAGVSLLAPEPISTGTSARADIGTTETILEAAFDAAIGGKTGQAGLAALAASNNGVDSGVPIGPVNDVIVDQSLRVAGLADLQRMHALQTAWAATFGGVTSYSAGGVAGDVGPAPRLKPRVGQ